MNWLLMAHRIPQGIFDERCKALAHLHSNAVNYPKSGQPVKLDDILKVDHSKPNYMAPEWLIINQCQSFSYLEYHLDREDARCIYQEEGGFVQVVNQGGHLSNLLSMYKSQGGSRTQQA